MHSWVRLLPKLLGNCDCLLLGDIKPHCGAKKKCAKNAKSSSHLEFNMMGHASCWVPLCTNNFRNSPGLAVYRIPKARCIVSECVRLLRNVNLKLNADSTRICIPLVFLEVKLPQAHLPSASLFLFFFPFISTFRFAISNCFNPAGTFHFPFLQVCLHSCPAK